MKTVMNINDTIKVQLTEEGYGIYRRYLNRTIGQGLGSLDTIHSFSLWEFMNIFGPHLSMMTQEPLFKNNEIILWEN